MASLDVRIKDLEWQYSESCDSDDQASELLDQRRRALDKKRHLIQEVTDMKIKIMREEP